MSGPLAQLYEEHSSLVMLVPAPLGLGSPLDTENSDWTQKSRKSTKVATRQRSVGLIAGTSSTFRRTLFEIPAE